MTSCVTSTSAADALAGLVASTGRLVDYVRETATAYDATTGAVTKISPQRYADIYALQLAATQEQQGAGMNTTRDKSTLVIAGAALPFEPQVNDVIEIPATSARNGGGYKAFRVTDWDTMTVGDVVVQYTLQVRN